MDFPKARNYAPGFLRANCANTCTVQVFTRGPSKLRGFPASISIFSLCFFKRPLLAGKKVGSVKNFDLLLIKSKTCAVQKLARFRGSRVNASFCSFKNLSGPLETRSKRELWRRANARNVGVSLSTFYGGKLNSSTHLTKPIFSESVIQSVSQSVKKPEFF